MDIDRKKYIQYGNYIALSEVLMGHFEDRMKIYGAMVEEDKRPLQKQLGRLYKDLELRVERRLAEESINNQQANDLKRALLDAVWYAAKEHKKAR